MKLPPGLFDPKGQIAKGRVHLEVNKVELPEYGVTVTGNHTTCYALVAPGDVITANFAINSGVSAEFADLVVDGILRNSWPNSRGAKIFSYDFERAIYMGVQIGETKKSKKMARMQVTERDSSKDLPIDGNHNQEASKVGSIEIQIFRKETTPYTTHGNPNAEASKSGIAQHGSGNGSGSGDASGGAANTADPTLTTALPDVGICEREPDFKNYQTWQDLNTKINSDFGPPSFEIGFFDGTKQYQEPTKRVREARTRDFKLWASFTFLLRSTAELQALDFNNVPLRGPPALTTNTSQSEIENAKAEEADNALQPVASDGKLFVSDGEDAQSAKPVAKPKKAPAKKISKRIVATEQPTASPISEETTEGKAVIEPTAPEQRIFSTTPDNAMEGKAVDESNEAIAVSKQDGIMEGQDGEDPKDLFIDVVMTEPVPEPTSKLEDKEFETKEQGAARKKAALFLPGVKSAPAHQAYLQRAPTEEPEDENDLMVDTSATTKSGLADNLAESVQKVPVSRASRSERLPNHERNRSSPPSINLVRIPSSPFNHDLTTSGTTEILTPSSSVQALSAHVRHHRRPSMPSLIMPTTTTSAPSSPHNRGLPFYTMPGFSGALQTPTTQMLPNHDHAVRSRHPSSLSMASESRPSTPPNRQVQIYSTPVSPILSRTSSPMNGQKTSSNHSASGSLQVASQTDHRCSEWKFPATLASSPLQTTAGATAFMMTPGIYTGHSVTQLRSAYGMKSESRGTTRPSYTDPTDIQMDLSTRPEPQDIEMKTTTTRSITVQSDNYSEFQTLLEQEDTEMFGITNATSQAPSEVQTEIETITNTQSLQDGRPASPAPSESITETPTEVASENALEISRKSSQREGGTSNSNNNTISRIQTPHQSFYHTEESPILGSSQRLLAAREGGSMKPAETHARHQDLTSSSGNLTKGRVLQLSNAVEGQDTARVMVTLNYSPTLGRKQAVDSAQSQLMSPPASAQKRKANSISGANPSATVQPRHQSTIPNETEAHYKENRREEEVALARKAAAKQRRMNLLTRHQAALTVHKERRKVKDLIKEAERLERENAELEATIIALEQGTDVRPAELTLSAGKGSHSGRLE